MNVYEMQQQQKAKILNDINKWCKKNNTTIQKTEQKIKRLLKKNMIKNSNNYFNLNDIMQIKLVKKFFNSIIITGDRSIGKSYQMLEYCIEKFNNDSSKFIWLRSLDITAEEVLARNFKRFQLEGWMILQKQKIVFVPIDPKKPASMNNVKEVVGYFLGLKNQTKKKSIEFGKVDTIIMDEFSDGVNIKNKLKQFVEFLSTAIRHNTKTKIIMSANYLNQADPILINLGLEQKKGKVPMVVFNWISGGLLWNIPKGHYQLDSIKLTPAYRWAVASPIEIFRSQYGGEFSNDYEYNIRPLNSFHPKKDLCFLYIDSQKLILGESIVNKSKVHYIVDYEKRPKPKKNLPIFVFTKSDDLLYKTAKPISKIVFKKLEYAWRHETLFTDETTIANLLINEFTQGHKFSKRKEL